MFQNNPREYPIHQKPVWAKKSVIYSNARVHAVKHLNGCEISKVLYNSIKQFTLKLWTRNLITYQVAPNTIDTYDTPPESVGIARKLSPTVFPDSILLGEIYKVGREYQSEKPNVQRSYQLL